MRCEICGCPYPGDHTLDCPVAPVEAREEPETDNDQWSLRDEGRSDGEGESYAERNA